MRWVGSDDFITTIVREDLKPGYKLAQSVHAAFNFSVEYKTEMQEWQKKSNYVCCLEASRFKIEVLQAELDKLKIKYVIFEEPDIGNELTAIAVEAIPRELHRKLFKKLKLALSWKIQN